jgi:hypothetical protein
VASDLRVCAAVADVGGDTGSASNVEQSKMLDPILKINEYIRSYIIHTYINNIQNMSMQYIGNIRTWG